MYCGQNITAFDVWWHLLSLIKQLQYCYHCAASPQGFGNKKISLFDLKTLLFCLCAMCTGCRGEESKEEVVGTKHL